MNWTLFFGLTLVFITGCLVGAAPGATECLRPLTLGIARGLSWLWLLFWRWVFSLFKRKAAGQTSVADGH